MVNYLALSFTSHFHIIKNNMKFHVKFKTGLVGELREARVQLVCLINVSP